MANTTAFETARYYVELQWLERFHDWRRADRWMADHYEVPAALCVGYLVVIFVLQRAMRERKPFDLSGPLFYWNLVLAAFSILGAIATVPYIALEVLHGAGASADMCLYYTEVPSCPPSSFHLPRASPFPACRTRHESSSAGPATDVPRTQLRRRAAPTIVRPVRGDCRAYPHHHLACASFLRFVLHFVFVLLVPFFFGAPTQH